MSVIEVGGNLYAAEVRTGTNSSSSILETRRSILKLENKQNMCQIKADVFCHMFLVWSQLALLPAELNWFPPEHSSFEKEMSLEPELCDCSREFS